jgi:hypothetical protein
MRGRRFGGFVLLLAGLIGMPAAPVHAYLDAESSYDIAVKYAEGLGRPLNPNAALVFFCRADGDGHAGAAFHVGLMYASGKGVKRDDSLAAAWFRRAAVRGHAEAKKMLAFFRGTPAKRPVCPYGVSWRNPRSLARAPEEIRKLVEKLAPEYRLDPKLVLAVIAVESSFLADAVSSKNAQGLMQLIPATAARFGVADIFDPVENIRGGMAYLRWLLREFRGDVTRAVAAYNAGEGAVVRYRGVPPFKETQNYVKKIRALYPNREHPL